MLSAKRILLMYISEDSGHHCASISIEKAIRRIAPDSQIMNINVFNYTNPILEKVINRAYMGVVKRKPEIWDYLYDNPKVMEKTRRLREMIHNLNSPKLKVLLDDFKADIVICTQAFPCGMVADYKKTYGLDLPIVGVLTDYAPHSYWLYNNVDCYVAPSGETAKALVKNGISADRVKPLGIPIDPKFSQGVDPEQSASGIGLDSSVPTALVMGGTQGLGPIKEFVFASDNIAQALQLIVVTGTNRKLHKWLLAKQGAVLKKKFIIYGFTHNIDELMAMASIIVTKAGGITTAEALARGLPMIILNPLPGQEAMNTNYLLQEGVALRADDAHHAALILEELLYHDNAKLKRMGANAKRCASPNSATDIANLILSLAR